MDYVFGDMTPTEVGEASLRRLFGSPMAKSVVLIDIP
jgi:hypothetical protein